MITNQEIFDNAWQAFVVQGRPFSFEVYEDGVHGCLYRGPNGAKCAIGLCIRDEDYRKEMETEGPCYLSLAYGIKFEDEDFACDAQRALHDNLIDDYDGEPPPPDVVREAYVQFAVDNNLKIPEEAAL